MRFSTSVELGGKTATGLQVPDDLVAALAQNGRAQQFFDALAFSHRKEWVRWVEEAKKADTRSSRISKAVEALSEGKKTH